MTTLDSEVRKVVENFVHSDELFTALDVSNKVKLAMPFARHSEVRDVVRSLFTNELQHDGWARTPIQVTLPDGRQETALLYHPLTDSWDLDLKYDNQKRAQASFRPGSTPVTAAPPAQTPAPVVQTAVAQPPAPQPTRALWDQLFNSQPSLFPRK